ncbi:MAG: FUSC family protein [Desulfocapsaceae bacterium]
MFGNHFVFFTAMIGFLLFSIYDISAASSSRLKEIVIHGSMSVLCTPLAIISGNHLITSILFLFSSVFLSSMAMSVGNRLTKSLFMTNAWLMIALAMPGSLEKALTASLCLLGGGCAYVVFSSIVNAFASAQSPEVSSIEEFGAAKAQLCSHLSSTSPVLQFALLRSLSVSAALLIGWQLFDSVPFWMAYTVFFVVRPGLNYSLKPVIERGVGTLLGTLLAYCTILMMGVDSVQIKLLFLIALSACIAEGGTRYYLFVTLLTYALLLYLEVSGTDIIVMGNKRLLATLIGICIALLTIVFLKYLPRLYRDKNLV